jgi:CheY-like chemotaxis protein
MLLTIHQLSRRILVADDDPVIRHLVAAIVKKEGYTVVLAGDGREAYRILQKDADFKAAIFDMMMPHLEGLDLIRFMSSEKRLMRIPVMMITSEPDLKLMANSFAAGATVYLSKPFTTERLQTALQMLLSNSNRRKSGTERQSMNGQKPDANLEGKQCLSTP